MTAFVTGGSGFVGRALIRSLTTDGIEVRALARSPEAAGTVEALGAQVVRGDLNDEAALRAGCDGADWVFHSAAWVKSWGDADEAHRVNVDGTQALLDASRAAGVARFVHVSTEAVLADYSHLVDADERRPYPARPMGPYPRTKGEAERRARQAARQGLHTVIVRPRLIWGLGDTALLPMLIDAVQSGRFVWIDGGTRLTSHVHVRNVVHGLRLAAERGGAGEVYFVTDGQPHTYREVFTRQLEAHGLQPPQRSMPLGVAKVLAAASETLWRWAGRRSMPPLNRTEVAVIGHQMTVDDGKARRELGYAPVVGWEEGLAEIAAARDRRGP